MRGLLKRFDELDKPDFRSLMFVRGDSVETRRNKTIEDHYADIAAVKLTDEVPEEIWQEFETVRNVFLYSWYVYDFTVPAVMYGQSIVEKALKLRCSYDQVGVTKTYGLRRLLDIALERGWLKNRHFPFAMELARTEIVESPHGHPMIRQTAIYAPDESDYARLIARNLPEFRNANMHGESALSLPGHALHSIQVCACVINALFPELEKDELTDCNGL